MRSDVRSKKTHFLPSYFLLLTPYILILSSSVFAQPSAVSTYDELLAAIRKTRLESRARIEQAVRQEKVREAFEIGHLIDAHVLHHKQRAEYGAQVLKRLADDLGMSGTELGYMLAFARTYPIYPAPGKLSWAHYRELLSLNDDQEREEITEKAVKNNWSSKELRLEVKKVLTKSNSEPGTRDSELSSLEATPGQVGVYRITKNYDGASVLDLGFSNYYRPPGEFDFTEGDIVQVQSSERFSTLGFELETLDSGLGTLDSELYTYHAYIINVIDGDTFNAVIDLGFGISTVQTLRLRGLDAPEIESAEGREAKEYLEKILTSEKPVLIRSMKSDKYDRYLVDIWANDIYVNQKLIDEGHAVIVDG